MVNGSKMGANLKSARCYELHETQLVSQDASDSVKDTVSKLE